MREVAGARACAVAAAIYRAGPWYWRPAAMRRYGDARRMRPKTAGRVWLLAWQAGASLADLEFVQFHPTALALPGRRPFCSARRCVERAPCWWTQGARLWIRCWPAMLLPAALPATCATSVRCISRYVIWTPAFVRERFPNIAAQLREWGLDLARDLLPVAPAAHYCMGGVRTDVEGRTDVPGLYVAGEAACTGAQGANRLASNSLLECLVFGAGRPGQRWKTSPHRVRTGGPSTSHGTPCPESAVRPLPATHRGWRDGH